MRLTATVTKADGAYVAHCPDVDVASEGDTVEEALANLREAVELYFEDNPAPRIEAPIVTTIDVPLKVA